jgi:hypothetical protein
VNAGKFMELEIFSQLLKASAAKSWELIFDEELQQLWGAERKWRQMGMTKLFSGF